MLTLTEMTTQCAFTVNNFTRPASMFILVQSTAGFMLDRPRVQPRTIYTTYTKS